MKHCKAQIGDEVYPGAKNGPLIADLGYDYARRTWFCRYTVAGKWQTKNVQ